ncbi:MAG: ABC transporter permease [Solirubrobacteraceae bacterium]
MINQARAKLLHSSIEVLLMLLVVLVALAIALIFMVLYGVSPGGGISAFVQGSFGSQLNVAGTLSKMIPLTLVALGWIVAFRSGRIHVGFPGQIIVGGIFSSIVALKVGPLPLAVHLPLTILAGAAGGALFAWLAAVLWARRGVNEILSTLLLNLVAAQLLDWWVQQPFHDSTTPLPQTPPFPSSALYPSLLANTDLHWDIVVVPVVVVVVAYVLARTTWGFRVRVSGANEQAARHAGIAPKSIGTQAMIVSGALAGLAGASLVLAGTQSTMGEAFEGGFGFLGIAVALLARNSPWGVLPAALLFGALAQGGQSLPATVNISSQVVGIVQGLMIMLVLAATTMLYYRQRSTGRGETDVKPASAQPSEVTGPEMGVAG